LPLASFGIRNGLAYHVSENTYGKAGSTDWSSGL
jgi:hypothetical protein